MQKAKVAKKTAKLNAVQLVPKVQISLTAVAAHPTTFTGATALLAAGNTAVTELSDADTQVAALEQQAAQAREVRDMKRVAALEFYDEFATYVNNIANGDASIILLAAMDVALPPGPAPAMTQVLELIFVSGTDEQTADSFWRAVYGARFYEMQISTNPNDAALWKTLTSTSTVGLQLTGLTSGQKAWVRVRAVNSVDKGPWSEPACAMIP